MSKWQSCFRREEVSIGQALEERNENSRSSTELFGALIHLLFSCSSYSHGNMCECIGAHVAL